MSCSEPRTGNGTIKTDGAVASSQSRPRSASSCSSSSSFFNFNDGSELIVDFSQRGQHRLRQILRQGQEERQTASSSPHPQSHHAHVGTNAPPSSNNSKGKDKDEGDEELSLASTTSTSTYKQVRFSDDIRSRSIPYPSHEELIQRWDSKENKVLFKQELARDVYSIRHLLSSTPMEALEKEVLYWCLGLEALVSVQVTRLVRRMKVEHSRSIVQMQHHLSDEQLARYAMRRSLQSRERAQELAAGNWEILQ